MKCFKCGNNVLPGSSTCPCCGNVVNKRIETERTKNKKVNVRTYRENKKNINSYNKPNVINNSPIYNEKSVKGVATFIKVFIVVFFILPFCAVFFTLMFGINSEFDEYDVNDDIHYEENVSNLFQIDKVTVDEGRRAKSGDLVFVLNNENDVDAEITLKITFFDVNNNVVDSETEYVGMSANATQVAIINSSLLGDYTSYEVLLEGRKAYWDYVYINPKEIELTDNGSSLVGDYTNVNKKIASSQMCLLLYNDSLLVDTICSYELNIDKNETREFNFSYYFDKKYNGLEFTKYELYLASARYDI